MVAPERAGEDRLRLRAAVRGAVQGVGFRPFIYRLAAGMGLKGQVVNTLRGVLIEAEGTERQLRTFLSKLEEERPPRSHIQSLETTFLDPVGYGEFTIIESDAAGDSAALVMPDIAVCPDCLKEISDPKERRYRYPFTNCTNCGPRFSIIETLPYDRPRTSMKEFVLCPACREEYENPLDRRFHAQPIACPLCGPHLELWDGEGAVLSQCDDALREAAAALRGGLILAVKGLGGFQLMADARSDEAVRRLRQLKHREEKPLALMYPSLVRLAEDCRPDVLEVRLLVSPESPIVLLKKAASEGSVAPSVAPGNPYLGVMLPNTPLHHLLLADLGFPLVATSGNISDEPICTDEREALERLKGMADFFLVHNRTIVRHVDDSIARIVAGREIVLRRARGYAPLPVYLRQPLKPSLAVGAHLKNAVAVARGREAFLSQHIGDLETGPAYEAFRRVTGDMQKLYGLSPEIAACDAHPDYLSTGYAAGTGLPHVSVQHHLAHVLACAAENELEGPFLGVAWDGSGYGNDGLIWGGEFLAVDDAQVARLAHFRPFPLPGGDRAVKEPRRTALGILYAINGDQIFHQEAPDLFAAFTPQELSSLRVMLGREVNCPQTTSAGRLFDAAAALAGLCRFIRFEGQAAMALEFALDGMETEEAYAFDLDVSRSPGILNWERAFDEVLRDAAQGIPAGLISAKFHNGLVEAITAVAIRAGRERVALAGGCFQNKYLTERALKRLRGEGFRPYWHQRVPPNDGGIALGQLVAASYGKEWINVSGRTG